MLLAGMFGPSSPPPTNIPPPPHRPQPFTTPLCWQPRCAWHAVLAPAPSQVPVRLAGCWLGWGKGRPDESDDLGELPCPAHLQGRRFRGRTS